MSRVEMPTGLAVWVADRIAAFPVESAEGLRWLAPAVAEHLALPLYIGWWDVSAIRADGELVSWSTDDESSGYSGIRPIEERHDRLTTLVLGSQRYEEIRVLLPPRPGNAEDCLHLLHPAFADGKVICPECCGLGWVRPGDRLTSLCSGPTPPRGFRGIIKRLLGGVVR